MVVLIEGCGISLRQLGIIYYPEGLQQDKKSRRCNAGCLVIHMHLKSTVRMDMQDKKKRAGWAELHDNYSQDDTLSISPWTNYIHACRFYNLSLPSQTTLPRLVHLCQCQVIESRSSNSRLHCAVVLQFLYVKDLPLNLVPDVELPVGFEYKQRGARFVP